MSTVTHKVILSVLISQIIRNFPHQNFRLFYQNLIIPQSLIPRRKWKKIRRLRLVPDLIIMTEFSPEVFGNGMSLLKGKRIFNYMGMLARVQLPIKKRQFMDFLPISLDNSPVFTCLVRFFAAKFFYSFYRKE